MSSRCARISSGCSPARVALIRPRIHMIRPQAKRARRPFRLVGSVGRNASLSWLSRDLWSGVTPGCGGERRLGGVAGLAGARPPQKYKNGCFWVVKSRIFCVIMSQLSANSAGFAHPVRKTRGVSYFRACFRTTDQERRPADRILLSPGWGSSRNDVRCGLTD